MTHDSWCRQLAGPQMTEVSECSSPVLALVSVLQYQATPAPAHKPVIAKHTFVHWHHSEAAAFKHSTYTLTYDTQIVGGGHNQHHDGLSYGFFDSGSWGWAMLTFKSHAIVYEWIKHISYSAYNCANAARRLLHLWEALLWFRWVDAACSGEHWGRCEHWALQSLVSNMGDNFGI